jgi:xylulose-5-phosphate/fructose-6-phosphate phosphoketolase
VLSEHLREGYLPTGRRGLFASCEAFAPIVASRVSRHAKWLRAGRDVPGRKPLAWLNLLPTSHVWRRDHNGFSHQDPGFLDHAAAKGAEVARILLPPDADTVLHMMDGCLHSRHRVNVVVAAK